MYHILTKFTKPGLLFGPYEEPEKMKIQEDWYDNDVPKGFGKELYESDLDRLDKCIEHAMDLLPIMQDTDITVSCSLNFCR